MPDYTAKVFFFSDRTLMYSAMLLGALHPLSH